MVTVDVLRETPCRSRSARLGPCRGHRLIPWIRIVSPWNRLPFAHAAEMLTAWLHQNSTGSLAAAPTLDDWAHGTAANPGKSEDGSAGWLNWIVRPASGGPAIGFVQATLERKEDGLVADLAWLVTPKEHGSRDRRRGSSNRRDVVAFDRRPTHPGFHPSQSHRLDAGSATDRACTHERSDRRRAAWEALAHGR